MDNYKKNIITIISGVSVPSEVINLIDLHHYPIVPYFGFIKIDDAVIRRRLQDRGWSESLINDNLNWAHYLEKEVSNTKNHYIIDASHITPGKVAQQFVIWLQLNAMKK